LKADSNQYRTSKPHAQKLFVKDKEGENKQGAASQLVGTGSIGPDGFGTSSMHMKSLMKSFSNGNF
jgi:hypothetical protein